MLTVAKAVEMVREGQQAEMVEALRQVMRERGGDHAMYIAAMAGNELRAAGETELAESITMALINACAPAEQKADPRVVRVTTAGGRHLVAKLADLVTRASQLESGEVEYTLSGEWDMRHGLIHNPRYYATVSPRDVVSITYAAE